MADKSHEVRIQAQAFVDALSKLTAKERAQTPNGGFGEQFNRLLSLAMDAKKDLDSRSWPPAIVIKPISKYESLCQATYAEIEAYARIILGFFPPEPLTLSFG